MRSPVPGRLAVLDAPLILSALITAGVDLCFLNRRQTANGAYDWVVHNLSAKPDNPDRSGAGAPGMVTNWRGALRCDAWLAIRPAGARARAIPIQPIGLASRRNPGYGVSVPGDLIASARDDAFLHQPTLCKTDRDPDAGPAPDDAQRMGVRERGTPDSRRCIDRDVGEPYPVRAAQHDILRTIQVQLQPTLVREVAGDLDSRRAMRQQQVDVNRLRRFVDRILVSEVQAADAPVDAAAFHRPVAVGDQRVRIRIAVEGPEQPAGNALIPDAEPADVAKLILDELVAHKALDVVPVPSITFLDEFECEPDSARDRARFAGAGPDRVRDPTVGSRLVLEHPCEHPAGTLDNFL